jgi:alanine-synthesizing transaminase
MFSKRTDWKLTHNRFTETQHQLEKSGRAVLDLTVSNPTRVGVQHDERIFQSLLNPKALDYDPQPKGMLSAREAVVNYYRDQYKGSDFDPESLILTTSTSEGYSYVFRLLCNPQEEILVPKPSYPLFEFLADLQDVKLVPYPLLYDHGWQIDFPSLNNAVTSKTRAVVLVHPNNPTGSYVSQSEQNALNKFYPQRTLQDFRFTTDETGVDCYQWPRGTSTRSHAKAGSDCGHLPFGQRADTACHCCAARSEKDSPVIFTHAFTGEP